MLKTRIVLMVPAGLLLLVVNWLAFHYFHEAPTAPYWLMLVASFPVLIRFGRAFWNAGLNNRNAAWKGAAVKEPGRITRPPTAADLLRIVFIPE